MLGTKVQGVVHLAMYGTCVPKHCGVVHADQRLGTGAPQTGCPNSCAAGAPVCGRGRRTAAAVVQHHQLAAGVLSRRQAVSSPATTWTLLLLCPTSHDR